MSISKSKYLITYSDEDGNEDIIEVSAYSREQALIIIGRDECLSVEEVISRERNPMLFS